jgi:hypothetical protein
MPTYVVDRASVASVPFAHRGAGVMGSVAVVVLTRCGQASVCEGHPLYLEAVHDSLCWQGQPRRMRRECGWYLSVIMIMTLQYFLSSRLRLQRALC